MYQHYDNKATKKLRAPSKTHPLGSLHQNDKAVLKRIYSARKDKMTRSKCMKGLGINRPMPEPVPTPKPNAILGLRHVKKTSFLSKAVKLVKHLFAKIMKIDFNE